MRNLLLVGSIVLVATLAIPGRGQARSAQSSRDRFIGAWQLAWLEEPDSSGKVQKADCTGLLVYTPDGHMSVQVMYQNPQTGSGTTPARYTQGGYEASYGTYQIKDDHRFTFHVEGALVRSLIGKDLPRVYAFSGKQLIVKSPDPNEHWKATWERFEERSGK